jgi:predicted amidohydrolase
MHPIFDEFKIFSKGNLPFSFLSPWGTIGIGICHDTYMFPEIPRFYAALGSRIYINLTAIPASHIGWKEFYFNQLKARSLENSMFVASANLVGKEIINQYMGSSVIFGPGSGKESHQAYVYGGPASETKEEVIISTLDLMETDYIREKYPLFEKNELTDTPDWRLQKYIQMLKIINEKTGKNKYIG